MSSCAAVRGYLFVESKDSCDIWKRWVHDEGELKVQGDLVQFMIFLNSSDKTGLCKSVVDLIDSLGAYLKQYLKPIFTLYLNRKCVWTEFYEFIHLDAFINMCKSLNDEETPRSSWEVFRLISLTSIRQYRPSLAIKFRTFSLYGKTASKLITLFFDVPLLSSKIVRHVQTLCYISITIR